MKTAMYTLMYSEPFITYGQKMIRSFKRLHPDIDIFIFDKDDIDKATERGYPLNFNYAYFGEFLCLEYDLVIHIDADCVVCAPLTEFLEELGDVLGCLNFSDNYLDTYNVKGKPLVLDILHDDYITAGVIASRSSRFWYHWKNLSKSIGNKYPQYENDVLNIIFQYGGYLTKVIDKEKVFYGTQSRYKWDKFYIKDEEIYCEDRQVKVVHWAGGHNMKKLDWRNDGFRPEVCKKFEELTT